MNADEAKLEKVDALYRAALDVPAGQRASFLEAACGDDPGVRAEVERKLREEGATVSFDPNERERRTSRVLAAPRTIPGMVVGDYRLTRRLGSGGMGEVWEAERCDNGRKVAVKLLSSRLAASEKAIERFLREGRLAAAVAHPRSTFVFEAGRDEAALFIAMELMPGTTLTDLVEDHEPLRVERAVDLILDVVEGLAAAHRGGVVHRDVKPSNCFLDGHGGVKIGDYGLSKSLLTPGDLTQSGSFMGTPVFSPPEQLRGAELDARSDQYSVGATLFYLIAGRPPFEGDSVSLVAKIVTDPAPPLDDIRPEVPAGLARIVARTLQKNPAQRFPSLEALAHALAQYRSGGRVAAAPVRRLNAFVVDCLLATMFLFSFLVVGLLVEAVGWHFFGWGVPGESSFLDRIERSHLAVGYAAYFAICEAAWGQSIGKRLLHLRVQGSSMERPGPWKAILRAAALPGIPMALGGWAGSRWVMLAGFLLFAVSMRPRNGYRGLHDLATSTRVVRIVDRFDASEVRLRTTPLDLPCQQARSFGPFREIGTIAASGADELIQGRDDLLHRDVWIWIREQGPELPTRRIELSRPARLRWLQGGTRDGRRWDAFEAFTGQPLAEAVTDLSWSQTRKVLLRLAEELDAGLSDGTLPPRLTLENVWVDGRGGVRLVDIGPSREVPARPSSETEADPEEVAGGVLLAASRAVVRASQQKLRAAYRWFRVRSADRRAAIANSPSAGGWAFARELADRPANRETLDWATEQLRGIQSGHAVLTWYQRLGSLVLSTLEWSAWWLLANWMYDLAVSLGVSPPTGFAVTALVLAVGGAAVGALTRGGPAFLLSDLTVVTLAGCAAGRFRCAIRYLVVWVPLMAFSTDISMQTLWEDPRPLTLLWHTLYTLLSLCGALGLIAVWIELDRGLQDYLVGTRLVPR